MGRLAEAIEEFSNCRLDDQNQVRRDVNVVSEIMKDHMGRWPFGLIQNCDDAEAAPAKGPRFSDCCTAHRIPGLGCAMRKGIQTRFEHHMEAPKAILPEKEALS